MLGQRPDGKLLGEIKAGMAGRAAFPNKGGSQSRSVRVYMDIL